MKKLLFIFTSLLNLHSSLFAQTATITDFSVTQRTDGSGLADIYFTLSGTETAYYIAAEASFDGGNTYSPILAGSLTGDTGPIGAGAGKHIIWNGVHSFPDTFSAQAKVKLIVSTSAACGQPITISHTSGAVAPVSKTVTYGTVTNIPGEPSKCWITSNLGADHQASGVGDGYEASAGWYWQFNRKQGYKHDGTTVAPSWTITSISENSDWIQANDPCNIELDSGWRIPTYTEWSNLHATGGWTDWNGPWNSGLKLHAAGWLSSYDGSLLNRGSNGSYWSNTQYDATNGWFPYFGSGGSSTDNYGTKAYGFTLRCVKEIVSSPGQPCPVTPTILYEGQTYNTVQIGTQCWLKENLNIGTKINGSNNQANNGTIEKYCYNNDEANCAIYGGLYQWNEMMQYVTTPGVKGICPSGWHIPTDPEWTALTTFLGGTSVAGGKMKSTGTIQAGTGLWNTPNTGATNESGLTAFPAGTRGYDGVFDGIGKFGLWWSSSESTTTNPWNRYLYYNDSYVYSSINNENFGFSVRCLRD
ncbi:MAG: FISUMP domain-containing protein [bacterium]